MPASRAVVVELLNPNGYPEARASSLRPWVDDLVRQLAGDRPLAVRFVGDRQMRRLNLEYRDQDATTDVLSFPGDESFEDGYLGDIAISVPVARRQAAEAGHDVERELRILLLHGILHCLGYDHESDDGEMLRLEKRLRRDWVARR